MKPRTRTAFELFPKQVAVLKSDRKELLIGGNSGRTGASYALRVLALNLAFGVKGARILLARKNDSDLRRNHLEGEDGLFAMVADMQRNKACEISAAEIRFANGSSIRWSGVSSESEITNLSEQRFDVLLFDNLEETSEPIYSRLRNIAVNSAGPVRRVVAATSKLETIPWAARRFVSPGEDGCGFLELLPTDVDPKVVAPREVETFREFIEKVRPGFAWRRHTVVMANAIQRLVDGELENLAIFVPPQHGKSELGPRLGAAYQLSRFPSQWIGLTSYNASTAEARSFDARQFYTRRGHEIEPGAGGIGLWRSRLGGGVWAAGIDGGQTGNPMSLGIIDDPDKNYIDAVSPADRKKKRAWFGGVWLARESMFAAEKLRQMMIATRWDVGDTVSYVMQQLVLSGKRIHVVVLPAIYDPEIAAQFTDPHLCRTVYGEEVAELMPKLVTVEPDWRQPGEAIDPERRSAEEWTDHARGVGALTFETTWQQNPMPATSGGIYDRAHFRILREPPPLQKEFSMLVRAWDDAASDDQKADATASVLVGRVAKTKRFAVLAATEDRIDGSQVKALKVRIAREDGPGVIVKTPQDPGAAGKTDVAATELELDDWVDKVVVHRPTGSKKVRARNPSSIVTPLRSSGEEHGQVDVYVSGDGMVGEVELRRFLDVLHRFTGAEGGDDDLADAFADAVNEVAFPGRRFSIH